MNNLSFKAKLNGFPLEVTAKQFEWRTENDNKHELRLLVKDSPEEKDTFILSKNGKETITYQPDYQPANPRLYNVDHLLKIFKMMKVLEARDFVNKSLEAKKSKIKQTEFEAMDNESV